MKNMLIGSLILLVLIIAISGTVGAMGDASAQKKRDADPTNYIKHSKPCKGRTGALAKDPANYKLYRCNALGKWVAQ
jgi:hypothetical protein